MTRILVRTLLLFLSALAIINYLNACGKNGEAKIVEKEENVLIPVEVAKVVQDDISAYITATSTLQAEEEAEVVAKTSGIVQQIFVEEGDRVTKGQILAKLEDEMLAIEVERARAELLKLEHSFKRDQELFEKNLISSEQFQNTRFQYEAQKAAFEKAKLNLEYAKIRAPISGVVAVRYIKTGNMVKINQPVFKIVDFDPILANIFVPETEINKVQIGQKAQLRFDATNGTVYEGYVQRISPIVDPSSGTVKVILYVENRDQKLKPGMFARVKLLYDTHQKTLLIPREAVITEDDITMVYTVQDSQAIRKPVKLGYSTEKMVEILQGLSKEDLVVVVGQNSLKDSSKVEIVNSTSLNLGQ